jgi:O-antigen/teichoic acid export membrane protein
MKPLNHPTHRVGIRTAAGATVLIATRLITRCIDLGALAVLGRLLSPADFGLVAIAMSVIMIVEAVMELPIGMALVTFPTRTKLHYDTAFTIQLIKGMALALILLILAWPLSHFYSDPRLIWLICALSIAPASRGLGSPRFVEYAMELDFGPTFLMEIVGKLVAFALSVGLAWSTGSYWSIAIGTIATPITMVVVSYFCAPYLPAISIKKWRDFSGFFRWTTASQTVAALNWQMDQLILGRFVSRLELGRFSMAANLSALPTQIFVGQVMNPLVVAFSLVREDTTRLKRAFQKSALTMAAIGLPIMVGMSMNAEPIIRLVLGEQWLEAAPILRWLCLSVIPSLFVGPLVPLAITLNRAGIFFRLISIEFFVKMPLMLIATFYYGIVGVIAVRLATALVLAVFTMLAVRELIGLPMRTQLLGPWRSVMSAIIMALVIAPLEGSFANVPGFLQLTLGLTIVVGVGAIVYASSTFLLWRLGGCPEGIELDVISLLAGYARRIHKVTAD